MSSTLCTACVRGDVKRVKVLLARWKGSKLPSKTQIRDVFTGWTPLHAAAASGRVELVKALLEAGFVNDINDHDPLKGSTPLHLAARSGYHKVVKLLVACGADPFATDSSDASALQAACASDRTRTVECMLAADKSEDHSMVTSLGHSSARCQLGGCGQCWDFGEAVERVLMDAEKKHADHLALAEMQSFLRG